MYFEHYFPFYATYANPMLYEGERMQEQEFELMKSYYPITVQQWIKDICLALILTGKNSRESGKL